MNTVIEIIKSICVGSVVVGAVWLILPSGNLNKTMRYVLGLVFLLILITPIVKKLPGIEFADVSVEAYAPQSDDLNDTVTNQVMEMAKATAKRMVVDVLTAHGVSYREISVEMDISDSYCISISRVDITLEKGEDRDAALAYIQNELGIRDVMIRE